MSINPDAVGEPSDDADEYLKDANAEDPRSGDQPPAHEPAGAVDPERGAPSPDAPE